MNNIYFRVLVNIVKFVAILTIFMSIINKDVIYVAGIVVIMYASISHYLSSCIVGQGRLFLLLHGMVGVLKPDLNNDSCIDIVKKINDITEMEGTIIFILNALLVICVVVRVVLFT